MRLNNIQAAPGARKDSMRVGRGIGSGKGKTCGRGHKGQHSRNGGSHTVGFEGGQMPLQRRLPKVGFSSRKKALTQEVFLYQLDRLSADTIDLDVLREAGLVGAKARKVKVVSSGELSRAVTVSGLLVTAGARTAIEAAGGRVE